MQVQVQGPANTCTCPSPPPPLCIAEPPVVIKPPTAASIRKEFKVGRVRG
jgi:hypothetical protein